jgi:DNA-binding response OmpR family regulator
VKCPEIASLQNEPVLANRSFKVLIVEDDKSLAILLEDMLADLGHQSIGAVHSLGDATHAARKTQADLVLLDVNLGGFSSFPVADILCKRKIPFIFLTGYGKAGIEQKYDSASVLAKPFGIAQLASLIDTNVVRTTPKKPDAADETKKNRRGNALFRHSASK